LRFDPFCSDYHRQDLGSSRPSACAGVAGLRGQVKELDSEPPYQRGTMKRRDFIGLSAAAMALHPPKRLPAKPADEPSATAPEPGIDPIVPFRFYYNRKEFMFQQMIQINRLSGLRRFLLTAPMEEVRLSGFPSPQVYRQIGEQVLEVKNHLAPYGLEVGWWCAPSLRSGFKKGFQYITDLNGTVSETTPCPLCPDFSEEFSDDVATVVRIARPFMVQFEDDYELSWQPPSIRFGCFCPHHLAAFARRQNRSYTREELLEIFKQVTPESLRLRRAWAELSRDSLVELAVVIRKKIDAIAPETRIALCQSGMTDFDGDFTEAVTRAFAGNTRPAVRLYGSSYSSDDALSLPENIFHALYSRQRLPAEFECFHESDTYPHTRFFMSAAKIRSLMTAAFAYGLEDSLFYATQYLDHPMEERGYLEMFRDEVKRFSEFKQAVKDCPVAGCEILHRPFGHIVNPYKGGNPGVPFNDWVRVAGRFGIPYTSTNGAVKLLSGVMAAALDEAEIEALLRGGLFMDGEAAHILQQKGWGELLGAKIFPGQTADFCYEGVRTPEVYPSMQGRLMYNLIFSPAGSEGGSFFELQPSADAAVITDFLDPQERPVIPGMIRYENKWGGRVAVMAFKLSGNRSSALFNYKKKELVRHTIEWLGKRPLPVFVRQTPNVMCIFNQARSNVYAVATLISLNSDPYDSLALDVAPEWIKAKIELLQADGRWKPAAVQRKGRTLTVKTRLERMAPVVLRFS